MNAPPSEDSSYKHADYDARAFDLYAEEKYRFLWTEVLPRRDWPRALNAGCGSGEANLLLAAACDEVVAIDPDAEAVSRAEALARGAGARNVDVRRAAIDDLDPSQRFDLIVAVDILEHIEDDAAALDTISRLLAPGGTLFLTVPAGPALMGEHDVRLGHFRRYTRGELAAKLSARFQLERCAYFGASLVPVAFAVSRVARGSYPVASTGDAGLVRGLLRRVLRAESVRTDLPFGTSLISVSRSPEPPGPGRVAPRGKWPKRLPLRSEAQRLKDEAFVELWLELLPRRFGLVERYNHGRPAVTAPAGFRRTLELGAGRGEHLQWERLTAEQRRGYHMLELREGMCAVIRARHPGVSVIQGDCQRRLDYPDGHFDRILAIHVLEHLPDLPAAIREAWRLCDKERGVLQVVIPCEGGLTYGLARRLSAQRIYEGRFGLSYRRFIEREHLNHPREVQDELAPWFEVVERDYFPFKVPNVHLNLVIGLTLRPRAVPLERGA